jgi:hypothetical protein
VNEQEKSHKLSTELAVCAKVTNTNKERKHTVGKEKKEEKKDRFLV